MGLHCDVIIEGGPGSTHTWATGEMWGGHWARSLAGALTGSPGAL